MGRIWRCLAAFGLTLLTGCTALQLTYNQADLLLAWRANAYFDLDPPQKHEFRQRIDGLLAWHRREQLPDYVQFVRATADRARGGVKRDDILWFIDGLRKRYRVIVDHGVHDAADMLATLNAEQLRALAGEWAKDNRRFVDDHQLDASAERQKRARLKRMLSQITDWTGGLTLQQEKRIEAMLEAVPATELLRHQERLRRQREFLELLHLRSQRQVFQKQLHAWLLDWERGRPAEQARVMAEAQERRIEFYIAIERMLTPAQREHLVKRLQGFGDDFKALSQRLPAAAVIVPAATIALH